MNRIQQLFANHTEPILSVYFCAGSPGAEDITETLLALQNGGASLVEIGIPFSDPMADGPTIQHAATQALKAGMSLRKLFADLRDIRSSISMPLVLMGYLNPIYQYGFREFCESCREVGIDGLIVPDLPFDLYIKDYKPIADEYGLNMIMLITPQTSNERVRLIDEHTRGFIYQVSTDATTGEQGTYPQSTLDYFERVAGMNLRNPTLVGFGVSNKATFDAATLHSRGAIVGSLFQKLLASTGTPAEAIAKLKQALAE